MRKLLAVVLSVLMLVSVLAVFPASAATDNTSGLIFTEIAMNTSFSYIDEGNNNKKMSTDGFAFFEIYNSGDTAINMYDLSVAMAPNYSQKPTSKTDPFFMNWDHWKENHSFVAKADIKSGPILNNNTVTPTEGIVYENSVDDNMLDAKEVAVIWMVSDKSITAVNEYISEKGLENATARKVFLDYFTKNYSTIFEEDYQAPTDLKIYMIWAAEDDTTEDGLVHVDTFTDTDCSISSRKGFMYGIVKDTVEVGKVDNGYINYDGATKVVDAEGKLTDDVLALAAYGAGAANWTNTKSNTSVTYAPATCKPDYANADAKFDVEEDKKDEVPQYDTYLAAGYAEFATESAVLQCNLPATPGMLANIQCAYFAADKAPTNVATGAGWEAAYIANYVETFFSEDELEAANPEKDILVDPPSREELEKIYGPKPKPSVKKKGCGSSIASSAIVITSVLGLGIGFIRKKKEQ